MSRTDPQVNIRMPEELKERLEQTASAARRSLNSEIVALLDQASQLATTAQSRREETDKLAKESMLKGMEKSYPSEVQDRYIVRFPDGMRDTIADAAKANNRSMNAEIVSRLAATFGDTFDANESFQEQQLDLMAQMLDELKDISSKL